MSADQKKVDQLEETLLETHRMTAPPEPSAGWQDSVMAAVREEKIETEPAGILLAYPSMIWGSAAVAALAAVSLLSIGIILEFTPSSAGADIVMNGLDDMVAFVHYGLD